MTPDPLTAPLRALDTAVRSLWDRADRTIHGSSGNDWLALSDNRRNAELVLNALPELLSAHERLTTLQGMRERMVALREIEHAHACIVDDKAEPDSCSTTCELLRDLLKVLTDPPAADPQGGEK